MLSEYFAPHRGGTAVYYYEVLRRLPRVDITVVTRTHPEAPNFDPGQPFATVRIPFLPIPKVRVVVEWCAHFLTGLYLVIKRRIDVVHAGQVFPLGLAVYGIHLLTGIPYILYVHGEEVTTAATRRLMRAAAALVLRRAGAVFVNSWFSATQIRALGVPAERIHIACPGVDPRRFHPQNGAALRARLGDEGCRVLLSVGRLTARKGQDTMIRLLPRVAATIPNIAYWIAGDGPRAELQRLRKLAASVGVLDKIRFLGTVPDKDLPALYAACDVFVMLNRAMPDGDVEGFGIVFLEANACGKPVVGGLSGGVTEAVRDGQTGFLITGNDDDAAVAVIVRLLGDPGLCKRLGDAGRRRALRHFSWDRAARRVAHVTVGLGQFPHGSAAPLLEGGSGVPSCQ